ncbi:MAG: hypothetical protein HUJ98_04925 [Bacteroidaceae bacterium]|nr:hypothetical protein [Bacteroidaceae bacterium]
MDGIINDVDSLKEFRNHLLDTVEDLEKQLNKTEGAIQEISQNWKDSQFEKFRSGFDEDKNKIKPLCASIKDFEGDVLYPLEKKLRDYLEL